MKLSDEFDSGVFFCLFLNLCLVLEKQLVLLLLITYLDLTYQSPLSMIIESIHTSISSVFCCYHCCRSAIHRALQSMISQLHLPAESDDEAPILSMQEEKDNGAMSTEGGDQAIMDNIISQLDGDCDDVEVLLEAAKKLSMFKAYCETTKAELEGEEWEFGDCANGDPEEDLRDLCRFGSAWLMNIKSHPPRPTPTAAGAAVVESPPTRNDVQQDTEQEHAKAAETPQHAAIQTQRTPSELLQLTDRPWPDFEAETKINAKEPIVEAEINAKEPSIEAEKEINGKEPSIEAEKETNATEPSAESEVEKKTNVTEPSAESEVEKKTNVTEPSAESEVEKKTNATEPSAESEVEKKSNATEPKELQQQESHPVAWVPSSSSAAVNKHMVSADATPKQKANANMTKEDKSDKKAKKDNEKEHKDSKKTKKDKDNHEKHMPKPKHKTIKENSDVKGAAATSPKLTGKRARGKQQASPNSKRKARGWGTENLVVLVVVVGRQISDDDKDVFCHDECQTSVKMSR